MRSLLCAVVLFMTACHWGGAVPVDEAPVTPSHDSLIVDLDRSPNEIIEIWPNGPPGEIPADLNEHFVERDNRFGLPDRSHNEITRPVLSVFKPSEPDGSAMLLIPGGGYKWVVVEKEGWEGARWFNRRGVTVYVLSYRLPHQGWAGGADTPLQDAQRAMRVIRSRSEIDSVDVNRIALMGFSAGGHLAGLLTTKFDQSVYNKNDAVDILSARPDASILIYPVITLTPPYTHGSTSQNMAGVNAGLERQKQYSVETAVPENSPPVFILHASDDQSVPVENALIAYDAFRHAGVPTTVHIFDSGGHGFGLRGIDDDPLRQWPDMVMHWGQSKGIFE